MGDNIRHRCDKWAGDVKIHPECDWLWGTCLEYCDREITDGKTGEITKDFWILLDETSGTFSVWKANNCPFCKVELKNLINK